MLAPIDDRPLIFEQLFGSLLGGPAEAYHATHLIGDQVVRVFCAGHPGYDISCPVGTPVRAMKAGLLRYPGPADGYSVPLGLYAVIQTLTGEEFWAAHLSQKVLPEGTWVVAGQIYALSGNSGNSTGAHLHLAKRPKNPDYYAYDGFVPFLHQFDHPLYEHMDFSRT